MTITLIGDSLCAGNLGIPYSRYLDLPEEAEIVYRGRDGDTVQGVIRRLEDSLRVDIPDLLVIQVGANDILLPEMAERGGNWSAFIDEMKRNGSIPSTDIRDFTEKYTEMIDTAASWGVTRIVCVTIPPIGEDLNSNRNRLRTEYNSRIRKISIDEAVIVADVSVSFEDVLKSLDSTSAWLFSDPADFIADIKVVRRARNAMELSEERGLYLTMDGAHLNERGAELMGKIISKAIKT